MDAGDVEALSPELVYVEFANALAKYVEAGIRPEAAAHRALEVFLGLQLFTFSLSGLVGPALVMAVERGVSAYDGCYLALAELSGSVLVTADRRLAGAATNAVLIAG